jgi:hypothetical protein
LQNYSLHLKNGPLIQNSLKKYPKTQIAKNHQNHPRNIKKEKMKNWGNLMENPLSFFSILSIFQFLWVRKFKACNKIFIRIPGNFPKLREVKAKIRLQSNIGEWKMENLTVFFFLDFFIFVMSIWLGLEREPSLIYELFICFGDCLFVM